jgi:hypothetical protein
MGGGDAEEEDIGPICEIAAIAAAPVATIECL